MLRRGRALGLCSPSSSASYRVQLNDSTGEASSLGRRIVFDAIQAERVTERACPNLRISSSVSALNVRSMPGTQTSMIGQLAPGQQMERLATVTGAVVNGDASWHRIRFPQGVGYVSGRYAQCD